MDYFKIVTDYINNTSSFELLGTGADREAYLHSQTGLVLKYDEHQGQNLDEWKTYNLIKKYHTSISHLVAEFYYGDEEFVVMERADATLCEKLNSYKFDTERLNKEKYQTLLNSIEENLSDRSLSIYGDNTHLIRMQVEEPHVYEALVKFISEADEESGFEDLHDENVGWFEAEGVFKIIDLGYCCPCEWKPSEV